MKKTIFTNLLALTLAGGLLTACSEKAPAEKTGTTNTEDMVEGVDGGLDSLNLPDSSATTTGGEQQ
ncbi:hypothetical protein [Rufibacter hautae]|uniref:Entericidin n=1 Tax=Rufibacter hautae TaxID=2595005 RepID=A0A5B6TDC2_9BACT|nr:hypothetical protein [Rufibacter hautae]KAA3437901.1 hypothetical protein FOA19_11495 [Rufibacter hautae]